MKAAGRTLTVGELRETLIGLRDDDPVTVATREEDGGPAASVEPTTGGGVEIEAPARAAPDDELLDFVSALAGGDYSLAAAKREARSILRDWGWT